MAFERIETYFNDIVDAYEERNCRAGNAAEEYCEQTALALPKRKNMHILDLGCGTGLELNAILSKNETARFTCVDCAPKMLARLRERHKEHSDRILTAEGDFLTRDCGFAFYDGVLSVMALHYYVPEEKLALYKTICSAIKENGFFLETDKFAPTANYEEFCREELLKRRAAIHAPADAHFHFDVPLTIANEAALLFKAGFSEVKVKWAKGTTAVLLATK